MTPQLWVRSMEWSEWRQMHPDLQDREAEYLYNLESKMFTNYQDELRNQAEFRKANLSGDLLDTAADISTILNEGGVYTPPPPPPTLPEGYTVWFDGSDTTTMQFTSNTVSEWDDKVGNIELNVTQFGNSNNITQGGGAVRFAENGMEATIIDGDATSYTDRGMTLFMVANIHSKDLINGAIGDVAHLYGRQLSTVDAGASIGQWAINARSVDAAKNDQFTPRFQVQSGTNQGNNFSGGTVDTGSIFLVEFQVSKSNSTAEMNVITQQNGNSDAKHYHSGYSGMSAISNNNDKGDSGTLTWDISEVDSNPYDSDTSYFHIIHYPKILNKQETEGVYKYFNYYNKTNFQYTASFLD